MIHQITNLTSGVSIPSQVVALGLGSFQTGSPVALVLPVSQARWVWALDKIFLCTIWFGLRGWLEWMASADERKRRTLGCLFTYCLAHGPLVMEGKSDVIIRWNVRCNCKIQAAKMEWQITKKPCFIHRLKWGAMPYFSYKLRTNSNFWLSTSLLQMLLKLQKISFVASKSWPVAS